MVSNSIPINEEPLYECGFEMHPEGHFVVGNSRYRPYWPRGLPENTGMEQMREMVDQSVEVLRNFHARTNEYPRHVRVARRPGKSMCIVIDQGDNKSQLEILH